MTSKLHDCKWVRRTTSLLIARVGYAWIWRQPTSEERMAKTFMEWQNSREARGFCTFWQGLLSTLAHVPCAAKTTFDNWGFAISLQKLYLSLVHPISSNIIQWPTSVSWISRCRPCRKSGCLPLHCLPATLSSNQFWICRSLAPLTWHRVQRGWIQFTIKEEWGRGLSLSEGLN